MFKASVSYISLFQPFKINAKFNQGDKGSDTLSKSRKKEKYNRHKNDVLIKLFRAKLTGSCKEGVIEGKNNQTINFLIRGIFIQLPPWRIGLTSKVY